MEEEGSNILSQIQCTMHRADDSTIADNNDTANDNGDNGFEPTTAKRLKRKKKGCIKNAHKRKGRMQGTNTYKRRVPTPDWKRIKMAVAGVIMKIDEDNLQYEGLHLEGGS